MQQWPAGIAYVCCPYDIDRATYIKDCFQNNRISIKMEDGSYHTYRDWETDRKSTRLNSSHSGESRMPSSA